MDNAAARIGSDTPYVIESSFVDARAFRILAPIWTESIMSDGMFDFDPAKTGSGSTANLTGFVGLDLDFGLFHNELLGNIKIAIIVLLAILVASGLVGRRSLQRALTAISDLQQPIAELARGNLSVEFKPAKHREISAIVEALESTASALSERDEKLLKLANHDVLTGLYNRRRFADELSKEVARVSQSKIHSALLFIDLDQFKYVNDTCGHLAGDRLIQTVARQLERSVGEDGIVARFGSDEFAVLVSNVSKDGARSMAASILEDMRQLAHVEEDSVFHILCSIGITLIRSGKFEPDDLIAQADIACREAKACGRNRFKFYSMSAREAKQMVADVGWMSKLREALDNDAFVLHYQPIVSITTGETSHHEVLVRMKSASGRIIAPDAFLPAAVRFGLMAEIDSWMIENAIAKLAEYRAAEPGLRFSINLSANAFESENLTEFVHSRLDQCEVPADCVMFEITESLAVRHLSHVEQQIAALSTLGCEVALDDFGTGYSSFSYLQQLSVDYIKIDAPSSKIWQKTRLTRKWFVSSVRSAERPG